MLLRNYQKQHKNIIYNWQKLRAKEIKKNKRKITEKEGDSSGAGEVDSLELPT